MDGYKTAIDFFATLDLLLANPYIPKMVFYVKINDAIHCKDLGGPYFVDKLICRLKPHGRINLMLDFKLADVGDTDKNILEHYREILERYPDITVILTVRESISAAAFMMLRREFPFLRIALVSFLTDISEKECLMRYGVFPKEKIFNDAYSVKNVYDWAVGEAKAGGKDTFSYPKYPFDLVVCSPRELAFLKVKMWGDCGFISPGIRDEWMLNGGIGGQVRIMGILEALDLVSDDTDGEIEVLFVMGTQLIKGNPSAGINANESIKRTYERMMQSPTMQKE